MNDDQSSVSDDQCPWAAPRYEQLAHEIFPLTQPPEEYAAREAHRWLLCSFINYRYRDRRLDEWLQRFSTIIRSPQLLQQCRQQFLTPQEIAFIEQEQQDDL